MSPTVRPWRPGDAVQAHIAGIYREFGLVFDPAFEDDLLDVGATYAPGLFLVAEGPEGIVGTCGVLPYGPARIVKRLYVVGGARRSGLARDLLRRCCAFGDFARTELWSDVRFPGAHRLYLADGFVPGPVRVLEDPDRSVERYFRR